jgi:hypothetical protein
MRPRQLESEIVELVYLSATHTLEDVAVGGLERLLASKQVITPFVGAGATIAVLPDHPAARWAGLLQDGIRRCVELGQSSEWGESTAARIQSGDLITLLAIADEVTRRLAGFGEWSDWIERTVGRLHVPGGSAMHTVICKLNRIVLTTNYDLLLEDASTHKTLHWQQMKEVRSSLVADERRKTVVHLNGVVTSPRSIILGNWIQAVSDELVVQFWQSVLYARTLLFIGCGTGLHDPDMGPSLQFLRFLSSPPVRASSEDGLDNHEHYILVPGRDLNAALQEFSGTNIAPVAYGSEYPDLERFLVDFADGREPRPTQNVHDYLTPSRATPRRTPVQAPQFNQPRIFLCYRREDTQGFARGIYQSLATEYGNEQVFRDIDSTPAGVRFATWIESRVAQCDVMVVLIGDRWLSVQDNAGQRRLDLPKDSVRQEIEVALRRDIPIIPVRIQGARMPSEDELPPSIADLIGFQSAEVTDSRWDFDVGLLIRAIHNLIAAN